MIADTPSCDMFNFNILTYLTLSQQVLLFVYCLYVRILSCDDINKNSDMPSSYNDRKISS